MMVQTLTLSIGLIAFITIAPATFAQTQWELIWEDDFLGNEINDAHWEHMIGDGTLYDLPPGWGNNELQYYTDRPENSYVANSNLHIVAREESYGGRNYTSARLRSKYLAEFLYGRIEARIKVPRGQGIWPAFWMLPTDSPYGGWAAGGEIDVVETINVPLDAHGTIHYGGEWPRNQWRGGSVSLGVDLSEDYHVYSMIWAPDRFTWFIDDMEYFTATSDQWYSENGGDNDRAPFDHFFHMLLNVAVGGNWPGPPDDTTEFPQTLRVDWVRVSMPRQTPFDGTPHPVPGRIEAEKFDEGWAEQAYHDSDIGNNGGQFRPDSDVDIESCREGGYNVGWIRPDEWIEYTIEAQQNGLFILDARVASAAGGRFRIEIDGVDRTGTLIVPNTGSWQSWKTISSAGIPLTRGEHIMRFVNLGSREQEFNVNWFEFRLARPDHLRPRN